MRHLSRALIVLVGSTVCFALGATPAHATTIWTDWTNAATGGPGIASGTVNGVSVLYVGEVLNAVVNGTSTIWSPNSSFIGGTSDTSPSSVRDEIDLQGTTGTNTITFGSPVTNPVFAIWSLGRVGAPASFTFSITPTFEAGGPNSGFGGSAITVAGNTVSGQEGNGVVQFTGTFSSISWTDTPEFYYAFTVGVNGPLASPVPEPVSIALLGSGIAGLMMRRRLRG
jgi:hypothetical protein